MKTIKGLLTAMAIIGSAFLGAGPACAQQDVFGQMKTICLGQPQTLRTDGLSKGITNNPVDIHGSQGIAKLDLFCQTNSGVGTLTFTLQQSDDLSAWSTVPNCAIATSNSLIYTNLSSASALFATNITLLPGVLTFPVAATAGFANPYLVPSTFNSNAVVTVSSGQGVYTIGFNAQDCKRYLRATWSASGGNTNYDGIAAMLTVRNRQ